MADKGKKNQIIVLEPCTDSVKELLGLVREKAMADIVTVSTPEEAIQNLSQALPCILITSLTDNSVVPVRVQLLKRLEAVIKQGALKVYMVSGMKNRQLADLFSQKLGVSDYIIDPVPARTMLFKVNLALKAVDNFRKIAEQKKAASEQIVIKKGDGKKAEADKAAAVTPKGKPALQMAEDTFLFKNGGVKKAGKKFVVEVEGPDPSTGEWKQHEDKGDAQSAWRWVPNEEKAAQEAGKAPADGWVHSGDKPAFNEETGKWALSSEKPKLALLKAGKVEAEKVSVDEKGDVVVAEDSPAAEANVQKNREKAAVAIKAREEARKVLREDPAKKEKDKQPEAVKTLKPEEKVPESGPGAKSGAEASEPGKGVNGRGPRAKLALGTGQADGGQESEGWEEEKGEFHNKLDGKKEQLRAVVDKRGTNFADFEDEKSPANAAPVSAEGENSAKPASPLDFLKKKKEQLEKSAKARPESDDLYAEGDQKAARGEPAPAAAREKKAKSSSAIDKLARLKAGLEAEPEEEAGEEWQEEKGEFTNKLDGKKEQLRSVVDRRDTAQEKFDSRRATKDKDGKTASAGELDVAKKKRAGTDLKKSALEEMKAKLREPLAEEMTPEEEESVRAELGLKNRPEIKVRELAKRKRAAEAERVKALIAEIQEDEKAADESGEVISHGFRSKGEEKPAGPRSHDLSQEKLKGIRAAIDGGETGEFGEETEERRRLRGGDAKAKGGAEIEDQAFYVPEAELLPKGNAWEGAGDWYVYLSAETRFKGFGQLSDLLPLWIFKGDRVPELLGKSKQWRFYGGKPVHAKTAAEVPAEVRDYLLGIRDQLASAAEEGAEKSDSATAPAAKDKKQKSKAGGLLDKLKQELEEEDSAAPEEESAAGGEDEQVGSEESGKTAAVKNSKKPRPEGLPSLGDDPLSALEVEETEGSSALEPTPASAGAKPKKDSASASLDALSRLRKKMEASEAEYQEPAPEEAEVADTETAEANTAPGGTAKKKKNEKGGASSLERLRRELDGEAAEAPEEAGEESAVESESSAKKEAESPRDAMKRLREQMQKAEASGDTEPAAEDEVASLAKLAESSSETEFGGDRNEAIRRLREKLIEKSENAEAEQAATEEPAASEINAPTSTPEETGPSSGVQKFLERRKARQKAREKPAPSSSEKSAPISVYLGLFVAVADALSQEKGSGAIPRVLRAFEDAFGQCRAMCTQPPDAEGMAKVSHMSEAHGEISIKLDSGKAEAISSAVGGSAEVVGYLFLQPSGERKEFSESELSTLKRVAAMLWPILARAPGTESKAA